MDLAIVKAYLCDGHQLVRSYSSAHVEAFSCTAHLKDTFRSRCRLTFSKL